MPPHMIRHCEHSEAIQPNTGNQASELPRRLRLLAITGLMILPCFSPLTASASVLLGNCDDTPHQVIIRNGGSEHTVTITQYDAEIEELGPMVSFQLKDKPIPPAKEQPVVTPIGPDQEFCIWSGKIKTQRLDTRGGSRGGGVF